MTEKEINNKIAELQDQANEIYKEISELRSKLPPPTLEQDGMVSRDAILFKDGHNIVGIHAIGYPDVDENGVGTFHQMEIWGNHYDKNLKMIGGSFRVFEDFDAVVADLKAEGFQDYVVFQKSE